MNICQGDLRNPQALRSALSTKCSFTIECTGDPCGRHFGRFTNRSYIMNLLFFACRAITQNADQRAQAIFITAPSQSRNTSENHRSDHRSMAEFLARVYV